MRMNMAGEQDTEASGLLSGGGACGTHPSEVSTLKESNISTRFDGSAAVPANAEAHHQALSKKTAKTEIEEE